MPKTIYDKPTRVLLKDMLADWKLQPGETFNARRAVDWFAEKYPKPATIEGTCQFVVVSC